ncbi:MAG: CPBP family intramembrane metalloprotease [Clostridia bacterium]|nr:CPBP family intramembrane metalloprotease [Clostridia bacterium]
MAQNNQNQPYAAAYGQMPAGQPYAPQPQPVQQPAAPVQPVTPAQPMAQPAQQQAAPAQPQPAQQPVAPTQPAMPYTPYPQAGRYYYPNGYPIQPNNPYYYNPALAQQEYEKRLKVEKAKKSLRYLGNMSGLSVILFLVFNTVASMVLTIPGIYEIYRKDAVFSGAFYIVASFFYMFLPFLIVSFLIRLKDKEVRFFPFKKMKPKRALLCIPIGLTICIGANIIVNLIITLFESFGLELSQQSDSLAKPQTAFALVISLVSTAVMPALLEEFAIRGVILQPARKYGMAFAIISSSVIFGVMHGNLIQAPFAFMVGVCFAFLAIKCDSLWIGVILHFLNNGFSVVMSYLQGSMKEAHFNLLYYCIIGAVALAGIVCFVVLLLTDKSFFKKSEGNIAGEEAALLTKGQKFVAFFINAPTIISFIIIGLLTLQYISK